MKLNPYGPLIDHPVLSGVVLLIANGIVALLLWHTPNEAMQAEFYMTGVTAILAAFSLIGLLISRGDPGINFVTYLIGTFTQGAALVIPMVLYPLPFFATVSGIVGVVVAIKSQGKKKRWSFVFFLLAMVLAFFVFK